MRIREGIGSLSHPLAHAVVSIEHIRDTAASFGWPSEANKERGRRLLRLIHSLGLDPLEILQKASEIRNESPEQNRRFPNPRRNNPQISI